LEDRTGGGGNAVHAFRAEVRVHRRRDDEDVARRQGADQLVKVEWDLSEPALVAGQLRHVARLAPALLRGPVLRVALVVVEKRIEPATRYGHLEPLVEHGGEDRVVPAERVANRGESLG